MPVNFIVESKLQRVLYGCDCMSSSEWEVLSIPVILCQWIVPSPPLPLLPPPTVLSITSTPIVCVVLTRQGINWVLLIPAFWSVSFERREPMSSLQTPLPVKGHFESLCSLTLRMCLLRCECNVLIRLFLLLKCSKNTSVHVEKKNKTTVSSCLHFVLLSQHHHTQHMLAHRTHSSKWKLDTGWNH